MTEFQQAIANCLLSHFQLNNHDLIQLLLIVVFKGMGFFIPE
ncbi:hypothetical protein [Nostoc sp. DSM 114161]